MGFDGLLALAVGLPALVAVLWPLPRLRRVLLAIAPWAAVPALILALAPGTEGASLVVPTLFTSLHLEVEGPGRAFLLLTALLWVIAGAFARWYHLADPRRGAFFGFFALTMTGNLGLVLAADILTFYLFFACMTFAAYGLVVHDRNETARRAGRVYLAMAILGEACILAGLFSLGWSFGGVPLFGEGLDRAWAGLEDVGGLRATALLLVFGFGVKAGMVPLHMWLPLAHPVAPTAASALLSGAMIKAGLLAWIRFLPGEIALPEVSVVLMGLGVASAFYGVVAGLMQDDPKTVLAYSSISQMGYMALGMGLVVRDPEAAAVAFLAVVLYAVHHGLSKGALFLAVGVRDRSPPGPRGAALVVALSALPALALSGAPLTTGAQVKGVLKLAIPELAADWYPVLDPALMVAAFGTTLLMARFLVVLWEGRPSGRDAVHGAPAGTGMPARGGRRPGAPAHGVSWSAVPWGLALPWVLLIALGVVGQLWLPMTSPAPPDLALPGPLAGVLAAAGPVLAGALVSWVAWRRRGATGPLGRLRVPPGDLVVPFESAARWVAALPGRRVLERDTGGAALFARLQEWSHGKVERAAIRDPALARGASVGILLLLIMAGLVVLLGG